MHKAVGTRCNLETGVNPKRPESEQEGKQTRVLLPLHMVEKNKPEEQRREQRSGKISAVTNLK